MQIANSHDPVECLLIKLNGKYFEPLTWSKFFLFLNGKTITFIQSSIDSYFDYQNYDLKDPSITVPTDHLQIFSMDISPPPNVLFSPQSPALNQTRFSKIMEEAASKAAGRKPQFLLKSRALGGFSVLVAFKDETTAGMIYNLRENMARRNKVGLKVPAPKMTQEPMIGRNRPSLSKIAVHKSRRDSLNASKSERSFSLLGRGSFLEKIRSRSRSKTPGYSNRQRSRSIFGRKGFQAPLRSGDVFQVGLRDQITSPDYKNVLLFLHLAVTALEMHGLHFEGLYRKCGNEKLVNELIVFADSAKINPNRVLHLQCWDHPYVLAAAIKRFLRYLPESILCSDDWQSLIDMVPSEDIPLNELEHQSVLDGLKAILLEMKSKAEEQPEKPREGSKYVGVKYIQPTLRRIRRSLSRDSIPDAEKVAACNSRRYETLIFLLNHLYKLIEYQGVNKCSAFCVATSIGPSLIDLNFDNVKKFNRVLEILLGNWKSLSKDHTETPVLHGENDSLLATTVNSDSCRSFAEQSKTNVRTKLREIISRVPDIFISS